jgi:hypothetical protein
LEEVLVHYITNKGMLNIKNANSKNLYYQLFDNQGRLLIQENNSLIEHRINIQNYPAGFFILSIIDGEGRRLHKKISKL